MLPWVTLIVVTEEKEKKKKLKQTEKCKLLLALQLFSVPPGTVPTFPCEKRVSEAKQIHQQCDYATVTNQYNDCGDNLMVKQVFDTLDHEVSMS